MADKKIKLEAVPETPADLAPKIAKKVNEAGVAEGTKKKLLTLMGKPETEAKLLKEDAAKSASEDLKKFKEKVLDKPADIVAVEAIRTDVHDKILAALGGEFEAGGDKYKLEDLDKFKNALKKPEEKKPDAEKKPEKKDDDKKAKDAQPEVEPPIETADQTAYTSGQVLRAGAIGTGVVGGGLLAGSLLSGASQAVNGSSAIPMTTRFLNGTKNFWLGARDIVWDKMGLSNVWNFGVNQTTALASKLGITTGAGANTAALAGLPGWMGPALAGAGIVGGAWLGSKLINGVNGAIGKKLNYTPWKVPFLGKIPLIGSVVNAAVSPLQVGYEGTKRVLGVGKWAGKGVLGGLSKLWENRGTITKFGAGAGLGAMIVAPFLGGSSLLWGLLGGQAARGKFKSFFEKWVPAPFGMKKSLGSGGHAGH